MAYDYETETLEHATMQVQLTARSDAGWRLVAAFAHPHETQDAQPKFIVFWERERP